MERGAEPNIQQPQAHETAVQRFPWLRPMGALSMNRETPSAPEQGQHDYGLLLHLMELVETDSKNHELLEEFKPKIFEGLHSLHREMSARFISENTHLIHQELQRTNGLPVRFEYEDGTTGPGLIVGLHSFEAGKWGVVVRRSQDEEPINTIRTAQQIRQAYLEATTVEIEIAETSPDSDQIA